MATEFGAILTNDWPRGVVAVGATSANESEVVVVGDEADLLTVRLAVDRQRVLAGEISDRGLVIPPYRKQDVSQYFRRQAEKNVRLILVTIDSAAHPK